MWSAPGWRGSPPRYASSSAASASSCTRPLARPAGAAGHTMTRSSTLRSTMAITCCSRPIMRRWPFRDHRCGGKARRSGRGGFCIRGYRQRRTMDAAHQCRPRAVVDFRSAPAGAGHDGARISCLRPSAAPLRQQDHLRGRRLLGSALRTARAPPLDRGAQHRARGGGAILAGAVVRETLAAGGKACRPLVARDGLGPTFIEPALRFLGAALRPVRTSVASLGVLRQPVASSISARTRLTVGAGDAVILAVPPVVATVLIPGLGAPSEFRAIVNAHFRIDPPAGLSPIIGIERHHRVALQPSRAGCRSRSVPPIVCSMCRARTGSGHLGRGRGRCRSGRCRPSQALPPWQIVRERRATFAATPAENAKRPGRDHGLAQSVPRRRLDQDRLAGDHRRCHPVRLSRGRSGRRNVTGGPW